MVYSHKDIHSRFVVAIVLRTFIDSFDARMGYYPKGFPCPS